MNSRRLADWVLFLEAVNTETELKIQYDAVEEAWKWEHRYLKSESFFLTPQLALINAIQKLCVVLDSNLLNAKELK